MNKFVRKNSKFVVYKIIHIDSGKAYIGITIDYKRRIKDHFNTNGNCRYLYYAIQKYGKNNFKYEIICRCNSWKELQGKEIEYIKLFKTKSPKGYNLTDGGDGMVGYRHTDKSRIKMSKSQTGRKASQETKQKQSISHSGKNNAFYNKEHSKKTKRLIGQKSKGRLHTENYKVYMKKLMTGRNITWGHKLSLANNKLSDQEVSKIQKMLSEGISQYAIADIFNVHQGSISNINRGKTYKHLL